MDSERIMYEKGARPTDEKQAEHVELIAGAVEHALAYLRAKFSDGEWEEYYETINMQVILEFRAKDKEKTNIFMTGGKLDPSDFQPEDFDFGVSILQNFFMHIDEFHEPLINLFKKIMIHSLMEKHGEKISEYLDAVNYKKEGMH